MGLMSTMRAVYVVHSESTQDVLGTSLFSHARCRFLFASTLFFSRPLFFFSLFFFSRPLLFSHGACNGFAYRRVMSTGGASGTTTTSTTPLVVAHVQWRKVEGRVRVVMTTATPLSNSSSSTQLAFESADGKTRLLTVPVEQVKGRRVLVCVSVRLLVVAIDPSCTYYYLNVLPYTHYHLTRTTLYDAQQGNRSVHRPRLKHRSKSLFSMIQRIFFDLWAVQVCRRRRRQRWNDCACWPCVIVIRCVTH